MGLPRTGSSHANGAEPRATSARTIAVILGPGSSTKMTSSTTDGGGEVPETPGPVDPYAARLRLADVARLANTTTDWTKIFTRWRASIRGRYHGRLAPGVRLVQCDRRDFPAPAPPANIQHFDRQRERHGEVDVSLRHLVVKALRDEHRADRQQEGQRQHLDRGMRGHEISDGAGEQHH